MYVASVKSSLNSLTAELDRTIRVGGFEEIEAARKDYPPEQNAATKVIAIKALVNAGLQPALQARRNTLQSRSGQTAERAASSVLQKLQEASAEATVEARKMIDFPNGRHMIVWSPDWISTILKCQDNRESVRLRGMMPGIAPEGRRRRRIAGLPRGLSLRLLDRRRADADLATGSHCLPGGGDQFTGAQCSLRVRRRTRDWKRFKSGSSSPSLSRFF